MDAKHELIPSRVMGRRMHLWRYGHYGAPLLAFPSASGMAHEWQANGMVDALSGLIEAGKLKLYTTETNVSEAWTRREKDPAWRIQQHLMFEDYVSRELVPFIREDCRSPEIPIAVSGTSLGAYYSANFVLKYPQIFQYALCMSGRYDISWLTNGFQNPEIHLNNPMNYLPGLDGEHLDRIRRNVHLVLVCGQGKWEDGNIEDTHRFADLLAGKGISHQRDLWGNDVSHAWPWWRRQAVFHLEKAFG